MPRSSLTKNRLLTRNNDTESKKRKRNNDEGGVEKCKKFRNSWLRDIKAVLRSAGNRQVSAENDTNVQTNIYNRNNTDQNESFKMTTNDFQENNIPGDELDRIGTLNIDRSDKLSCEKMTITKTTQQEFKENDTLEDVEEDCIFQTMTCNANGAMVRLENIFLSDHSRKPLISTKQVNIEPSQVNSNGTDGLEESKIILDKTKVVNTKDYINYDNGDSKIEVITDEHLLEVESGEEELQTLDTQNTIECSLNQSFFSDERINSSNNESYFFGNNNNGKIGRLDVGYVFALGQNVGERSEIDEGLTTSNAVTLDVNGIESIENLLTFESELNTTTIDNCDQMWMGICVGDCSQQNGCLQESEEYPNNFTGNIRPANESELIENEPKTSQAYYDANRGAFVDPSILQEPKPGNSSKTILNTWDSIKNLISRVSGQKTSNENEDDNSTTKTEDNLET